jgi:DNA topoisomerase VI subunit B
MSLHKPQSAGNNGTATFQRTAFRKPILLDFATRPGLIAQTGHEPALWPLVAFKELVDNSLDACEDARVPPDIQVRIDSGGIEVRDNGPGIPADVVEDVLDFSVRVSTREAYVSPTRGQQGNALKTIVAMPYVLHGKEGHVSVDAQGVRHDITMKVNLRQEPVLDRQPRRGLVKNGTSVKIHWPADGMVSLDSAEARFLRIARDYVLLNPHLTLRLDLFGTKLFLPASTPQWKKWLPSDPTSPHWYSLERFKQLVAAYLMHDADTGRTRMVRELVAEFCYLTGSAKLKAVLDAVNMHRTRLSDLADGDDLNTKLVRWLLEAMKEHSKPVKARLLGVIGKDHLATRFALLGAEMGSFEYHKIESPPTEATPEVVETAFAWCPRKTQRQLITGVNWSPGLVNPFRQLGPFGSLDTLLESKRAGAFEPVAVLVHVAYPRAEFTDRGKSAVITNSDNGEEEE